MKKTFFIAILLAASTGCKDKDIWCEDIGSNVKSWSVYDLNDSISMHDQFGNPLLLQITKYQNDPGYKTKERGGLMKKLVVCKNSLYLSSNTNYFNLSIESTSQEKDSQRKPDQFDFRINIGDLFSEFTVKTNNGVSTIHSADGTVEYDYTSGNVVYAEALVHELDTTVNENSVYRYVYAKDKGLVEFSTRNPARTYTID